MGLGHGCSQAESLFVRCSVDARDVRVRRRRFGYDLTHHLAHERGLRLRRALGIFEVTTRLGRHNLTVRGRVVDGVPRIGTFFIP